MNEKIKQSMEGVAKKIVTSKMPKADARVPQNVNAEMQDAFSPSGLLETAYHPVPNATEMQTPRAGPQAELYTTMERDSHEMANPLSFNNGATPR